MTDVAIIGMSCRFPGASSVDEYRAMLQDGRCCFRDLDDAELRAAGVPAEVLADPRYVKRAAPLGRIGEFDVDVFRIRPQEAASLDPQHYHLLECVLEALESAGLSPHDERRRIGLFAGADQSYYALRRMTDDALWDPMGQWATIIGNDNHFLATSIAYRLGLRGPAIEVQTACSTSLVAVHLAVQALFGGDCDVAVAGGVSIRGPQARGYLWRDGSILSRTGVCRPFDRDADGTLLASGVGVVVLQRLDDAIAYGFPICAVVKGTAVNNDGALRLAYSAPSGAGQAEVVREALRVAGVDPPTVGYIEAHGTATQLGDVTEYRALVEAFGAPRTAKPWCRIGSVKSNFGHLEVTAGVAGLIKAALSLRHAEIYPSLGFRAPNPQIDFDTGPFSVAARTEAFERLHGVRRAGVSSFGIGGTNCHVVLEEPPARTRSRRSGSRWHVLGVSAATPRALAAHVKRTSEALRGLPVEDIADASFTLLAGRVARPYRAACVICEGVEARTAPPAVELWENSCEPHDRVPGVVFGALSAWPDVWTGSAELIERLSNRLAPSAWSRVHSELERMAPGTPARAWAEGVLACVEVALWLVERGVRPSEVVGPAGEAVRAMLASPLDPATALIECFARPAAAVAETIMRSRDRRLVVELVGTEPKVTPDALVAVASPEAIDYQLARCLAALWVRQIPIDWDAVFGPRLRLALPTYPFDRRRVWEPPSPLLPAVAGKPNPGTSRQDLRTVLSGLWRGLLGADPQPGIGFLEAGGDSLLAARLATHIGEAVGARVGARVVLSSESFDELLDCVRRSVGAAPEERYLLSPGQEALWFVHSLDRGSPAYNVYAAFEVVGELNPDGLREAFERLVARQSALRTAFVEVDGRPMQRIAPPGRLERWEYRDIGPEASWTDLVLEHARTPLDLAAPPLLSVRLLKLGSERFIVSIVTHHIVSDEWSAQLMIGEVLEFYRSALAGEPPRLEPLTTTFGREAERMRQQLVSAETYDRLSYWRAKLSGASTFELPLDRARSLERCYAGAIVPFRLSYGTQAQLDALARRHQATRFMTLASAFFALLDRSTGQDNICIGTNVAGRDAAQSESLVGLFTNTVPLRITVERDAPFTTLLGQVRKTLLEAQERQLPLGTLVERLSPPRVRGRNPFFDVTIVLQNVPRREVAIEGVAVEPLPLHNGTCKFDLELCVAETRDGSLAGHWEYDRDLFDAATIERLDAAFHCILQGIAADALTPVSQLPVLAPAERLRLIREAAAPERPRSSETVWQLFRREAERAPAAVAVIGAAGERWTYGDLFGRASALGGRLEEAGAEPGVLLGLFCDRTERYVEALFAVLACGAAFVPLDPSLPDARLADLVADGRVQGVLVETRHQQRLTERIEPLSGRPLAWICIDSPAACLPLRLPPAGPPNLAYVVYTSGSTGKPKGAMVAREGMLNHLWAKVESLRLDATSVVAQTAPICFDISIWQIVAPLMVGGRVTMIPDALLLDVDVFLRRIASDQVTVLELVPSYLDVVIAALERAPAPLTSLAWLLATGEAIPAETCRRWFAVGGVPIVNAYGPTECSDDVTQHAIAEPPSPSTPRVPIGRALPNTSVHVLDDRLEPVPPGWLGEICIAGICVGLGYLGDPHRTAEAFVPDPFASEPGRLLYRTGDVGRRRADGNIEYLGRRDDQIKLRGVRIEIEEVEAVLRRCPGVGNVVAAVDAGAGSLVAFVEVRMGTNIDAALRDLRRHAVQNLPAVMVPAAFLPLDAIPRTTSGKVDRLALRELASRPRPQPVCQGAETESGSLGTLEEIWRTVLNVTHVPSEADFFDLGGDSLKALQIAAMAHRAGIEVSAYDIVRERTLARLCARTGAPDGPCKVTEVEEVRP